MFLTFGSCDIGIPHIHEVEAVYHLRPSSYETRGNKRIGDYIIIPGKDSNRITFILQYTCSPSKILEASFSHELWNNVLLPLYLRVYNTDRVEPREEMFIYCYFKFIKIAKRYFQGFRYNFGNYEVEMTFSLETQKATINYYKDGNLEGYQILNRDAYNAYFYSLSKYIKRLSEQLKYEDK